MHMPIWSRSWCNIPSSKAEITAAKIMFMQSDTDLMPHLVGAKKKWKQERKEIRSDQFFSPQFLLFHFFLSFEVFRENFFFPFISSHKRFFTERKMYLFLCRIVFANLFKILQSRRCSSVKSWTNTHKINFAIFFNLQFWDAGEKILF